MSDVERYIKRRKVTDPTFAEGFETGYREFEIGVVLRQAREDAGLTQEEGRRAALDAAIDGQHPTPVRGRRHGQTSRGHSAGLETVSGPHDG